MLTARQQRILRLIVDDYVREAAPISSERLTRSHALGVSAATVRNDVATLEEQGYISRPHASAGSIPEDSAYRLYVESCLSDAAAADIPMPAQALISSRFADVQDDVDRWGSVAAALVAQLLSNLGIATFPKTSVSRVKHLELIPVREMVALLIVVMEQAKLRKQLLRFDEPVDTAELESMSARLRSQMAGLTREEIEVLPMALTPPERRAVDATVVMLRKQNDAVHEDHYARGLRNLLDQPEFVDYEKARPIIHGVEDGSLVEAALEAAPMGEVVRVVIGREHRGETLKPLSVVMCGYGVPGRALGAVGVVGPTRMQYDRAISGVRFISTVMNRLVASVYGAA